MKSKLSDKLPHITTKQKQILLLLYKFRFLNTNQLQILLGHKNPNRTLSWIKDLIDKGCIRRQYNRTSFESNTKPAIYFLAPKARLILKSEKDLEFSELEYIYRESSRTKKFIEHCLFLADVYLYLSSQKENNEEIKFFTKVDLHDYEYFPDPIPDAFISVRSDSSTRYYFLDLFDDFTPPFVFRKRVRTYLEYAEKPDWDENTNFTPLPKVLFICPSESMKKHVRKYAIALLEKNYDDKISLFLTTKTSIEVGERDIWQKVE
jgi:hypothetical protein